MNCGRTPIWQATQQRALSLTSAMAILKRRALRRRSYSLKTTGVISVCNLACARGFALSERPFSVSRTVFSRACAFFRFHLILLFGESFLRPP